MLPPFLESKRPSQSPEVDHSTLSNYAAFDVKDTTLKMQISFDRSTISGSVVYELNKKDANVTTINMDTSFLKIEGVQCNGHKVTDFLIEDRIEPLGSKLVIPLAAEVASSTKLTLVIDFETTDKCTALQWLDGNQTSGKPYVFSQLEAIHGRSLFPSFDTPSVKSTFQATVESPLPVVFSGIKTGQTGNVYTFEQRIPIPVYLIGIASGDLVDAKIGPRSTVYSEPHMIKDCQWEFNGDVENFIQTAEKLIFPYEWGTYDILINVNSYPYGGMESPNMTFATPTLIAHDKSNIDVIAHELAHSWSGNLVTNCSWNHFWLNEGWTVYIERRIVGALHGEETRHFSALIGWNDLKNSIGAMRNPDRFSTLVQCLNDGTDPDEAFSSVPYEKGFNFLFYLENLVGGIKEFDPFIKHYFTKYAKKSLDTFEFLDTLFEFFADKRELLESVDWNTWLFTPGMPPRQPFITTLADNVYELSKRWIEKAKSFTTEEQFVAEFTAADVQDYNANQIVLLLETLAQGEPDFKWEQHQLAVKSLLTIYDNKIVKSNNAEVIVKVFKLKIYAHLQEYYQDLADWLATVGRMKFVRPGYRLLDSVDHKLAVDTFEKLQNIYHPICKSLVKQDLGL